MSDATGARPDSTTEPLWRRALAALTTEVVGVHPRLHAYAFLSSLLPLRAAGSVRASLLSKLGFQIGEGTRINGPLKITGPRGLIPRLSIGRRCTIEPDCVFDLSEALTLGDDVTLEPGVMILTSTHELDVAEHRAGDVISSPVTIGTGTWIRARALILPGVKIGAGAVVDVGAVVNKDVDGNTRVGGVPAVKLASLDTYGQP